ncbi:unnamed protein product [Adineta ricciae]|uniref:DED domain-containing protein n=1 Tax=Adineta ricciae TaxID=249248 RepID=A0A815R7H0_ADIRI|nr:unnamed protein product [Adineta ricciae]CAF1473205.1 unnamed protein product [Adineta ricciae]
MERANYALRTLLLRIDQQLTNDERRDLCFLVGCEDVPRRILDPVIKDSAAPMIEVWEALFDRRKITTGNVDYLIERLTRINRLDLAELLKNFCPLPFSLSTRPLPQMAGQVEQQVAMSTGFAQVDL